MKRRELWKFERARKSADTKLRKIANVVGTCISIKYREFQPTPETSFTIFVKNKIKDKSQVPKSELVPETIIRYGKIWKTDVVEFGKWVEQGPLLTRDATGQFGTCELIAKSLDQWVAITCAHALEGIGLRYNDNEIIRGSFRGEIEFPLGLTIDGYKEPKRGNYSEYGKFDAGVIGKLENRVELIAESNVPAHFFRPSCIPDRDRLDLICTPVYGVGSVSRLVESQITGVYAEVNGEYADVIVGHELENITQKGDSGLCWRDVEGKLISMHYAGERKGDFESTFRSASMFISRIVDRFDLRELRILP